MASFRDPIERAFSQWMMEAHRRADFPDLSFFATKGPRLHAMRDDGPASVNRRRQFSIVERGLYGYQLQRGFDHVDPAQWLLLEFGEITADPITAAARVAGFLGLAPFPEAPLAEVRMSAPKRLRRDGPTAQDIELLAGHFATDLELFARLSGLAVSHWPTVQILDGRLAAGSSPSSCPAGCRAAVRSAPPPRVLDQTGSAFMIVRNVRPCPAAQESSRGRGFVVSACIG